MSVAVFEPYSLIFDRDGQPLENGYLYFGTAAQNPQTNPIVVYWDQAGTQIAAQPIRTSGGYPVRNGSPARVYVNADDYSLTIRDKNQRLISSQLNAARFGASFVEFIQSGTGAVYRTAQAKMRETVSVLDFGAVGDGITDDTVAIQAALNCGAARIIIPYTGNPYLFTTLNVPNTVKSIEGQSGAAGSVTLKGTATTTTAITVDSDGINVKNIYLTALGTYTNGIVYATNRHFAVWEKVTVNGSFTNLFTISDNCYSQEFYSCVFWGADNGVQTAMKIGANGNALDFFGCAFVHCGVGLYVYGNSCEVINVFGGQIASNLAYNVRIGQGATSTGIEGINFHGVYFEDSPYNIWNDCTDTLSINCIGCRNSATATVSHIFLNRKANSISIIGGAYLTVAGGSPSFIDMNNTGSPGISIMSPYLSGFGNVVANQGTTNVNYASLVDASFSASQIHFPATQVPSSDVNTLDMYREGTWTPTDQSGAGLVFTTASGMYTRIGRLVMASFRIIFPATASGLATSIGGLPFPSGAATNQQHQGGGLRYTNSSLNFSFANTQLTSTFALISNAGVGITNAQMSTFTVDGMIIYQTAT